MIRFTVLISLLLLGLRLTLHTQLFAQNNQVVTPQPRPLQYEKQMGQSRKELRWSRMYKNSFDRTKEFAYLRLSAKHGLNAVRLYFEIQTLLLPERSAFTYKTRTERIRACQYYASLVREALHYASKYHLEAANPKYCKTRIR